MVLVLLFGLLAGLLSRVPMVWAMSYADITLPAQWRVDGTVWRGQFYPPGMEQPIQTRWQWLAWLQGQPAFSAALTAEYVTASADLRYAQGQWWLEGLDAALTLPDARIPPQLEGRHFGLLTAQAPRLALDATPFVVDITLPVDDQTWQGKAELDAQGVTARLTAAQIDPPGELVFNGQWPLERVQIRWKPLLGAAE